MANPEQGPIEQGTLGTWQTLSLAVPDFLGPLREDVSTFFGFISDLLSLLSNALNVAKVFASGLLDPITALIQKIRDTIAALLQDLRQIGLYVHGDFYILEGPEFQALRGGFLQYEARMASRLTDAQDPNRPDFTTESAVAAVFLYVGADVRSIQRILELIQKIAALFNRVIPSPRLHNQVTRIEATYGYDGASLFSFNQGFFRAFLPRKSQIDNLANPYNAVNLSWEMATPPGASFQAIARIPPAGFLVEISTVPGPLPVICERPIEGALEGIQVPSTSPTREIVEVLNENGDPILLTGGSDQFRYDEALTFNQNQGQDTIKVYTTLSLASANPIPLEDLREGEKRYLQKIFYVPFAQNLFFPGRKYGTTLLFKDMPYAAEWDFDVQQGKAQRVHDNKQPEKFYVRIRAVSSAIKTPSDFSYDLDQSIVRDRSRRSKPTAPLVLPTTSLGDRGPTSDVATILFPDASSERYLRAVAEALAICVLCRIDVPVLRAKEGVLDYPPQAGQVLQDGRVEPYWGSYEGKARLPTHLEDIADIVLPQLLGIGAPSAFYADTTPPSKFRRRLLHQCITTTNRLFAKNPTTLESRTFVLDQAEDLLNFRIDIEEDFIDASVEPSGDGLTLLEWLAQGDPTVGLALGPESVGIVGDRATTIATRSFWSFELLPRGPHWFQAQSSPGRGRGSVDAAPIAYRRTANTVVVAQYVRNLVPDSVYDGSRAVLGLAIGPRTRPTERGWIAFRLFPQGIPAIDRIFDMLLALLEAVQEAIDSLAETLNRYIEFLQSKIAEIQALLNRLESMLLQLLRFFASITPTAGLIVVGAGTQGILQGLLGASNKPLEPSNADTESYGGGVVLVAGGVPNLALNLFLNLFQGDG